MTSKPVAAVPMENFGEGAIPGATQDQNKVLAVVKNNDTEEGADIASDFDHLGSKFIILIIDIPPYYDSF